MEYTTQWIGIQGFYHVLVIDRYDGMRIGTIELSDSGRDEPYRIRASMSFGSDSKSTIELETDKSWGLDPELAAKAIWKYHLKHMSWRKRLRRWYRRIKAIWAFWLAIGVLLLSSDFGNIPANIDIILQFMNILE